MKKIAMVITRQLCAGLNISTEQYDACQYGIETLLHTIVSTAGLLSIGICFHMFPETLIIVLVFYINQTLGGGFHASSHLKCFTTMSLFLIFGLCSCMLPQILQLDICLSIVSAIILYRIPLVLHTNKQYLIEKNTFFVRRSRITIGLWVCIVMVCIATQSIFFRAFTIGLVLSAVSRIYAKHMSSLKKRRNSY